jgi:hypothetical protein
MKARTRTEGEGPDRVLVVFFDEIEGELRLSFGAYHSGAAMMRSANAWVLERGGQWP